MNPTPTAPPNHPSSPRTSQPSSPSILLSFFSFDKIKSSWRKTRRFDSVRRWSNGRRRRRWRRIGCCGARQWVGRTFPSASTPNGAAGYRKGSSVLTAAATAPILRKSHSTSTTENAIPSSKSKPDLIPVIIIDIWETMGVISPAGKN